MNCTKCNFIEEKELAGWRTFYAHELEITGKDENGYIDLCPKCTKEIQEYFKQAIWNFLNNNNRKDKHGNYISIV